MRRRTLLVVLVGCVLFTSGCAGLGNLLRITRTEKQVPAKPQAPPALVECRQEAAVALRDGVARGHSQGMEAGSDLCGALLALANALVSDLGPPVKRLAIDIGVDALSELKAATVRYATQVAKQRERLEKHDEAIAKRAARPEEVAYTLGSPVLRYLLGAAGPMLLLLIVVKVYSGKLSALRGTAAFLRKAVGQVVAGVQAARSTLTEVADEGVKEALGEAEDADVRELVAVLKARQKAGTADEG